MMNVPFLNLKKQYSAIWNEVQSEFKTIFETTSFINGTHVKKFEEDIKEYLEVKYVMGCNSGTDALVLALRACNVRPGDEVITTAFSFFATAEAIASIGAIPVFVDIKESDYNIDSTKIEAAISDKTKAIVPVHIFGAPCDMDSIMEVAKKYNLKVIEDDAQAIGSDLNGKKAGTLGDVGCFSFYPTKNLGGAGDGGMVTTNDENIYTALKALHEHGAGENGAKTAYYFGDMMEDESCKTNEVATDLYNPYKYYNYLIGYNSRLDSIQAAVLSIKLKYLDGYNDNRRNIAKRYIDELTDKVTLPLYSGKINPCWHQFVVRTDYKNELCTYLSEQGVGNGSFYPVPLHKQKAFNSLNSNNENLILPIAEKTCEQTVCLPIFPEMTQEEITYVIEKVNEFFKDK